MEALVISLQYQNFPENQLFGCYHDASNIIDKFKKIDNKMKITWMKDDLAENNTLYPTKENILREINNLILSKNAIKFFYFSGHGTLYYDYNKDEHTINFNNNGKHISKNQSVLKDSCLVVNDISFLNIISDDEICDILKKINVKHFLYGFLDCCHSGTGFDLAYVKMGSLTKVKHFSKIPITHGFYPDKKNQINGNIILISGTRDNAYAYESWINRKPQGHFTFTLCQFLDKGGYLFSLQNFYQYLIFTINNPLQVPVLSCSKNFNLNNFRMSHLTLKKFNSKKNALLRLIKLK